MDQKFLILQPTLISCLYCIDMRVLLLVELEFSRHDVVYKVVKVGAIDEALSLVARVHGSPAELVVFLLPLHEGPDWTTHHWDRLLVRHDQNLTNLINLNSFTEELTCEILQVNYYPMLNNTELSSILTNEPMRVGYLLASAVPVHVKMLVGELDGEADLHILKVHHD